MKPFKIPQLIGRSQPDDISQGPSKRQRINLEAEAPRQILETRPNLGYVVPKKPLSSQISHQRAPLHPIPPPNVRAQIASSVDQDRQFFNVLWRRPTTKKNKTWDSDGILACNNGVATLEDASGKQLGRLAYKQMVGIGSQLMIAGREVEIESVITKQDAIGGGRFLCRAKQMLDDPVADHNDRRPMSNPATLHGAAQTAGRAGNANFKLPMARHTAPVTGNIRTPSPRHDPDAPGALVMKRPSKVPHGKHLVDVVVDPLLTKHLREHQRAGVAFLYECVMGMKSYTGEGAILADEMGLGKTLQTIALIWTLLKQNPIYEDQPIIKKILIVCPVTLIANWRKEFHKWLGKERIGVLVADEKHTRITDFTLGKAYSVMIIGYERLRSVKEELQKGEVDIVIADEGHRLKSAKNKSADAIKSLATERRVILSGTPVQNDLEEFWTMVDFVNPNLLGKYSVFKREFETPILRGQQPGATKTELEKAEARGAELSELTGLFILRRTAEILSSYLPARTEYVVFCRPTPTQATVYKSIIRSPIFSAALGSSGLALELINVLKKVCNSPSLLLSKSDGEEVTRREVFEGVPLHLLKSPGSSGKLQVLDSLLHKIRTTTSEKVVLVSNYTSTLDVLARLLTSLSYPYLRLDGSTAASKRQGLVDRFNRSSANNIFVFLLSAKAGGVGLNLIGASRLVLFDIDWNPATDLQAMARIHRDGQNLPCFIYRLITKGALDEKIFQRQVSKTGLSDSIVDGKSSASSFTREELRDLFTLDESDACQTHELLGCTCKANSAAPSQSHYTPALAALADEHAATAVERAEMSAHDRDSSQHIRSSDICRSLTLSASMNIAAPNDHLRRTTKHAKDSNGHDKMMSLMQYSHLDTSNLHMSSTTSTAGRSEGDLADTVDDNVLHSVLQEDGGRVGFVFVKKSVCIATTSDE